MTVLEYDDVIKTSRNFDLGVFWNILNSTTLMQSFIAGAWLILV